MKIVFIWLLTVSVVISSCEPPMREWDNFTGTAYVPIYGDPSQLLTIAEEPVQATIRPGKIYAYGSLIFQNELNKGFHIIDNSNPSQPRKVSFLKVPYSTEIAIRNNFLYTNSISDLVVLDLQDPLHPVLAKRIAGAFPAVNQQYPPMRNVFFVCPDPSKGTVVDWEIQSVEKATCRR